MVQKRNDTTPRGLFMAQLAPLLPAEWRFVKYEKNIDEVERITVMLKQQTLTRMKAAPQGFYETGSVLEIVSSHKDPVEAEDELDYAVIQLCRILDGIRPTLWETATKVLDRDTMRMAYDIPITYQTLKDATT